VQNYATLEELKSHFDEELCYMQCDCCGYATRKLTLYHCHSEFQGALDRKPFMLCDICPSTMASKAHAYPSQFRGEEYVLKAISYSTNMILDKIKQTTGGQDE
jgi:hypothetical protein